MKIALAGASGNMGRETLLHLMQLEKLETLRILLLQNKKEKRLGKRLRAEYSKLEVIHGDISCLKDCQKLVEGMDYVLNLAAVIPPMSDHSPALAELCNYYGAKNLVDAISAMEKKPKLVHISSVALYGNRNYMHPWGRIGDPLLPSVYDAYALSKLRGERCVIDADFKWVILRQTAMLHSNMLADNMKDGLMFHTSFNVPLEWVTARDSGFLMAELVKRDSEAEIDGFWNKCFNIGGGEENRCTGYDTFDKGFKLIGGSTERFMKPTWNSIRNFHGLWFYDGDILENIFHYQRETLSDFWAEFLKKHGYYSLAKILPRRLISKFAIERLLSNPNAPQKWIENGDAGKVKAYFGSQENLKCLPNSWKEYPVFAKGQLVDADVDYERIKTTNEAKIGGYLLSHGYDESKDDSELCIDDMQSAAEFRGGKCLSTSMEKGDLKTKLLWQCHDHHEFWASPYAVLKAGHWCPMCLEAKSWDFDRLAKHSPFYAQVWYDTHAKNENCRYYFDANYNAKYQILLAPIN